MINFEKEYQDRIEYLIDCGDGEISPVSIEKFWEFMRFLNPREEISITATDIHCSDNTWYLVGNWDTEYIIHTGGGRFGPITRFYKDGRYDFLNLEFLPEYIELWLCKGTRNDPFTTNYSANLDSQGVLETIRKYNFETLVGIDYTGKTIHDWVLSELHECDWLECEGGSKELHFVVDMLNTPGGDQWICKDCLPERESIVRNGNITD